MSAVNLQPMIVLQYEEARRHIETFHESANKRDTVAAARALENAALAICRGLTAAVQDKDFWADAADLINPTKHSSKALDEVFGRLEEASQQEANILMNAGYSSESIGTILGSFNLALRVFRERPTGASLELAKEQVIRAQQFICEFSGPKVVIEKRGFWGRAYRTVMTSFKVLRGVGTIVCDVAGIAGAGAAAPVLTPLAVGVAIVSVADGITTISEVGEAIFGNV